MAEQASGWREVSLEAHTCGLSLSVQLTPDSVLSKLDLEIDPELDPELDSELFEPQTEAESNLTMFRATRLGEESEAKSTSLQARLLRCQLLLLDQVLHVGSMSMR